MRFLYLAFVLGLFALPLYASDPYEQELSALLTKHIVVLRNFYIDPRLTFDSDGKLTSKGTPGFGPSDGRVYIEEVHFGSGKLKLVGTRIVDVFDKKANTDQLTSTAKTVNIEAVLPQNQPLSQVAPNLVNTIFLKQSELSQMKCSAPDEQEFREHFLRPTDQGKKPATDQPPKNTRRNSSLLFPDR